MQYDAAIFGHLGEFYFTPLKNEITEFIETDKDCANIKAYLNRMKNEFWPDWKEVTDQLKLNTDWKSFKNTAK